MKNILYIFIVITLFSCKKQEDFEPTPEYLSIVGKWEAIEIPDHIVLNIEKNGLIQIDRNGQRGSSIQIDDLEFKENFYVIDGFFWNLLWCKDSKIKNYIIIKINNSYDTLITKTGNTNEIYTPKFVRQ